VLKEFKGKVAVITGAAAGIGRGLAEKSVNLGMKVVLSDVEAEALKQTEAYLRGKGGDVFSVVVDVSKAEQVQTLAEKANAKYGTVDLLCNNAGVSGGGLIKEHTLADWKWVLGVNLWGVIHGIHYFLPHMMKKNTGCHIVNTASIEGFWSRPGVACYQASKHAVVAISEVLKMELAAEQSQVGVSVLCPGGVNTRIIESGRNRPTELQNAPVALTPEQVKIMEAIKQIFANSMSPSVVADITFEAIAQDKFYIFTHPELKQAVQARHDRIMNDGIPLPPALF